MSMPSHKTQPSYHNHFICRRAHDDFVSIMPPLLSVAALFLIQPQTHQTALPQKQLSPKMRSASRSSPRPKAVGAHAACFTLSNSSQNRSEFFSFMSLLHLQPLGRSLLCEQFFNLLSPCFGLCHSCCCIHFGDDLLIRT